MAAAEEDDFRAERLRGVLRRQRRRVAGQGRPAAEEGGGPGAAAASSSSLPGPPPPPPAGGSGAVCCQLCGEDLSGLDAALRQLHANRCLDDLERLPPPSAGQGVAGCPLCGKGFSTLESRSSHLKRCATRMALPPPLLLQVVRQQNSSALKGGLPPSLSGLKRKVSSRPEQSTKKRKTGARSGVAEEELLVAMAMSRSLHEEEEAKARLLTSGRENRAGQGRKNPRGEKKNRVMPSRSAPTLLLQDPEKARRQMEERVAMLLSEADEFPSTPPLPPSRLLASELSSKADWPVALPKGPLSSLWERSSLVGLSGPGPFCMAGSSLPALPRQTDQSPMQSTALPFLDSDRPEAEEMLLQERGRGRDLQGKSPREEVGDAEGCGQKEEGALQDLMELAGEGLTLTQWNPAVQPAEETGQEWMPGDVSQSNLDQSSEKKLPSGSHSPPFLLGLLATAFKEMVNNPHLSDVQFQVDSGELFYAHMFVLYARCPQLMEVVDKQGFWVAEEGEEAKIRRVLLHDVSGEATGVFLNYLYTADHFVPQRVQLDVAALAVRFGVVELAALCTSHSWSEQPAVGASGQEEEGRVEKFEELLKSIWVGEEEEDKALLPEEPGNENVVDEQELEEIYEFAATQRKAEEERRSRGRNRGAEVGAYPMEETAVPGGSSDSTGSLGPEPSCLQVKDARKETVPGFPLDSPQDAEEQKPLGAASRRHLEALPELADTSREFGEKSLLAVSWGESLELFQQSYSGREPGDDAAGEDVAVVKSSTPLGLEKGPVPLSRNFSSGGSQVPLEVLADELSASPKPRGGFGSDLSLTLFSPALQEASEKPCQIEEPGLPKLQRGASAGTVASRDADNIRCAPAPLPSYPSPVDQKGGTVLMLSPEDKRKHCQGKLQVERAGFPSEEQEALGAMNGPLCLEVDIACSQGRGAFLLETLPGEEADAGGERIRVPDTLLLSCQGPGNGQVAKLGSTSGPEARQSGDALESAGIPSPKRQSLQGWLPLGHLSPSPRSTACQPSDRKSAADVVVILDDSEEEAEAAPQLSWGSSLLEVDLPVSEDDSGRPFLVASPEGSVVPKAGSCPQGSPARPLLMRTGTPPGGSLATGNKPLPSFECAAEESCSRDGSRSQRLDFGGQDDDETEILPLTQRLPAPVPAPKTPVLDCQEREVPCTTPPTPMPSYSIMETPVLKKELSRFGVRTLPKRQMVLKLKEIFQYTHQRSGSRDVAAPSQLTLHHRTQVAVRQPTSAAVHSSFPKQPPSCPELPQVLLDGGCFGGSSGAGNRGQMAKRGCAPAGSRRRKRTVEGPVRGGRAFEASQKVDGLSGAAEDTSVILQSSSTELESSTLTEEEEDDIPASQSADVPAALRQYIRSRPGLFRKILSYQPFELSKLQSELKQNGIRIGLGRLLEFLDAHCVTFTTAEARREKRQQSGSQAGKRKKRY